MKIEKLNENKIRITLNLDDLKEKNIDFHSFMSNSIDSQSLFLDMLEQAEEEIGFKTKDYKIMLEALATSDGNFILTVTRFVPELDKNNSKKKRINIKRKSFMPHNNIFIYEFNSFDDFADFCLLIDSKKLFEIQHSFNDISLYSYNSKYYLTFIGVKASHEFLSSFCASLTEFSSVVHNANLFNKKLSEYGKVIIKKNAIRKYIQNITK